MKTAISFLKSKLTYREAIKKIEETNADFIHVDLMDGKFTENRNLEISEVLELLSDTTKPLDIHLMVVEPASYIESLAKLKPAYLTIHAEIKDAFTYIDQIHQLGIKAGIAINPDTSVTSIKDILNKIDYVLVMGVVPGKGGQQMIYETTLKIDELVAIRENEKLNYVISFDGGVNDSTIPFVKNSDILVAGTFVCMSDDYQSKINLMR